METEYGPTVAAGATNIQTLQETATILGLPDAFDDFSFMLATQ